jgi:hypothetical protein
MARASASQAFPLKAEVARRCRIGPCGKVDDRRAPVMASEGPRAISSLNMRRMCSHLDFLGLHAVPGYTDGLGGAVLAESEAFVRAANAPRKTGKHGSPVAT